MLSPSGGDETDTWVPGEQMAESIGVLAYVEYDDMLLPENDVRNCHPLPVKTSTDTGTARFWSASRSRST